MVFLDMLDLRLFCLASCLYQAVASWEPLTSGYGPFEKIPESKFVEPNDFLRHFVAKNRPLLLKSASAELTRSPDFWNDSYLRKKYGDVLVNVDQTKVENRSKESTSMTLRQFLSGYKSKEHYLIDTLHKPLQGEFGVPRSIRCSAVLDRLQDFVWWFSSGGSKSTLHFDNVENLYCQISGTKRWIFVDPVNGSKHIPLDHPEGHYCGVNVSAVNFDLYPTLKSMPYRTAELKAGDCLYVPLNWWHQVTSTDERNMAINIWWAPIHSVDSPPCQKLNHTEDDDWALSKFDFNFGEWIRYTLTQMALNHRGKLDYWTMRESVLHEHTGENLITADGFKSLDANDDGYVTAEELQNIESKRIHAAVQNVPVGAMSIVTQEETRNSLFYKESGAKDTCQNNAVPCF